MLRRIGNRIDASPVRDEPLGACLEHLPLGLGLGFEDEALEEPASFLRGRDVVGGEVVLLCLGTKSTVLRSFRSGIVDTRGW